MQGNRPPTRPSGSDAEIAPPSARYASRSPATSRRADPLSGHSRGRWHRSVARRHGEWVGDEHRDHRHQVANFRGDVLRRRRTIRAPVWLRRRRAGPNHPRNTRIVNLDRAPRKPCSGRRTVPIASAQGQGFKGPRGPMSKVGVGVRQPKRGLGKLRMRPRTPRPQVADGSLSHQPSHHVAVGVDLLPARPGPARFSSGKASTLTKTAA